MELGYEPTADSLFFWYILVCVCVCALPLQGVTANFPPAKLKSGVGEHVSTLHRVDCPMPPVSRSHTQVCRILNELAECALKASHFTWKRSVCEHGLALPDTPHPSPPHRPVYEDDEEAEEVVGEEEGGELSLSRLEGEVEEAEEDSDDDGAVFLDLSGLKPGGTTEVRHISFPDQFVRERTWSGLSVP